MTKQISRVTILVTDDDESDRQLIERAMKDNDVQNPIVFLQNGEELIDLLRSSAAPSKGASKSLPYVILLDLNMPRLDGRETLRIIKSDPALRQIPTVILTTSSNDDDITSTYANGANSFFTKPFLYRDLVDLMALLKRYWLQGAALPS